MEGASALGSPGSVLLTPGLWGLAAALAWGTADFLAQGVARRVGPVDVLFAMLATSLVLLALLAPMPDLGWDDLAWAVPGGLGITLGTLALYAGLARGPVGVTAALVGAYPALIVSADLLAGRIPGARAALGMAMALAGGALVAAGGVATEGARLDRRGFALAGAAALGFAIGVSAITRGAALVGPVSAVLAARVVGVAALIPAYGVLGRAPRIGRGDWAPLALVGALDAGAFLAMSTGAQAPGGAAAIVVAAGFSAVTVILARVLLREAMTPRQWLGSALVAGGAALLSSPQAA